jgi:hypothetical protein
VALALALPIALACTPFALGAGLGVGGASRAFAAAPKFLPAYRPRTSQIVRAERALKAEKPTSAAQVERIMGELLPLHVQQAYLDWLSQRQQGTSGSGGYGPAPPGVGGQA